MRRPGWLRDRSSLAATLAIVLAFVLFSIFWITTTDRILGWMVQDHDLLVRLATYKGFLYILISAGMLFWLVLAALELRGAAAGRIDRAPAPERPRSWIPILLVALSALLVEGLGYGVYRLQGAGLEREAHAQMAYLASEKAERIEAWMRERYGDALVTTRDPMLVDQLRALEPGRRPGPDQRLKLERRLLLLQEAYHYGSVHLLDADGGTLAATDPAPVLPWERPRPGDALPQLRWQAGGLAGEDPQLHLTCVATIPDAGAARPLGSLVFRLDPQAVLGSLGAWPTASPSGEILLLAREGDGALFLNRTRRPGAPVLRVPMTRTQLVGVQALLSGDGLKRGVDYRDVPTVAFARRLTSLPWVLLVKVDRDEFLLPIRRLVVTYAGLGALFMVVIVASLAAWYSRERARERAERGRIEAESRARGQQLELLSRYGNDIVLVLDSEGKVLEANDRAVASYQFSREELRGLNVADLRAPDARDDLPQQFGQVKRDSSIRFRTVHLRRDGSCFPVEVSSMTFELDGRHLVQSIIRDITEQRDYEAKIHGLNEHLEQRVLERTAQLETAFREMEAFSYSVSHDLRGPLRGIDGFGYALMEEYGDRLDDQGRHYLDRIRAGTLRMGLIMDDLLDLSRLNRQDLTRSTVDLSAQARQILASLEQQETGPRRVEVAVQDGLQAQADPRLMQMVLGQLLNNAWKFTGKRALARIEFGAAPEQGPAAFFVRDNGAGFDMAYAGKLFGAFQRLHDVAEFAGSGIGLAIVQRILHRHGGRVWAEAAVDRGATFFFTLPA